MSPNDQDNLKFLADDRSAKIMIIVNSCFGLVGLLQVCLTFVQSIHILGFFFGLALIVAAAVLNFFIWKAGKDSYTFQSKRVLFAFLTVALGIYGTFVFIIFFIRLLGFMFSPNFNSKVKLEPLQQKLYEDNTVWLNFDPETGIMHADLKFPDLDYVELGIVIDWNKFKKCASRGAQTRVQNDRVGDFLHSRELLLHVNKASAFMGLIEDYAVYTPDFLNPAGLKYVCQTRIGHKSLGTGNILDDPCIKLVFNCAKEAAF